MSARRSTRALARAQRVVMVALCAVLLTGGLSSCALLEGGDPSTPEPEAPTSASVSDLEVDSQFTRDGTFQSHIEVRGARDVDFVYTLYPTKATPRTNEWYPRGKKYFTWTFQAYDLARDLRDPFETKREVYLDRVRVTSRTITADGGRTQRPYRLDAEARDITFDPEPQATRYGMLITSPKGSFELRNQSIGTVSDDTRGVELRFSAVVHVETRAGSGDFVERTVTQVVPIAIFASDERTEAAPIPVDAS
jgi:hypothetical protein